MHIMKHIQTMLWKGKKYNESSNSFSLAPLSPMLPWFLLTIPGFRNHCSALSRTKEGIFFKKRICSLGSLLPSAHPNASEKKHNWALMYSMSATFLKELGLPALSMHQWSDICLQFLFPKRELTLTSRSKIEPGPVSCLWKTRKWTDGHPSVSQWLFLPKLGNNTAAFSERSWDWKKKPVHFFPVSGHF